ncbi:recombinase family protein [Pseudonocardia sp. HH130630-07]|uniref:recombinase family protein n=1 Tax=Pseudonocardia sp. HH130630-07 TaxID=1690815 RepID=UPI000814C98B|nr:recombinase family protein [Pseudonocardia sp. HH130630-07]ANY05739.1 hypothetical protein AFB00_04825 [Pseudonocardia sp. HH130630-07]
MAATGRIGDDLRAHVLQDHHAELAARSRTAIVHRVEAGQIPLTMPFGYRRAVSGPTLDGGGPITAWGAYVPDVEPETEATRLGRAGRAPASTWALDVHTAWVVAVIYSWAICGVSPESIAVRLRTSWPLRPTPVTATGRPLPWTATRVRAVLLDPSYLGRSVWGRSRPRESWTVSSTITHPPLITPSTAADVAAAVRRRADLGGDVPGWGR